MTWFHNNDPETPLVDQLIAHLVSHPAGIYWNSGFSVRAGIPSKPGELCLYISHGTVNSFSDRYTACSGSPNDIPLSGWAHLAVAYSHTTGKGPGLFTHDKEFADEESKRTGK